MERNTIQDNKFFMGEREFTNIIYVLIRAYRFRNNNQNPEAVVLPNITEVGGVKVEFPKEVPIVRTGRKAGQAGSTDS